MIGETGYVVVGAGAFGASTAYHLARRGAGVIEIDAALARRELRPTRTAAGDELSERELAVLRLLSTPMSQREIGETLFVSLNTVKSHVKSIFRKLDATSRGEAVERAHERGLV